MARPEKLFSWRKGALREMFLLEKWRAQRSASPEEMTRLDKCFSLEKWRAQRNVSPREVARPKKCFSLEK
jgi:hypothetical protein